MTAHEAQFSTQKRLMLRTANAQKQMITDNVAAQHSVHITALTGAVTQLTNLVTDAP